MPKQPDGSQVEPTESRVETRPDDIESAKSKPKPSLQQQSDATSGKRTTERISAAQTAFTGDLQLIAVPDLLTFFKSSRRTGTLVVTSEANIGAVSLKAGNIIHVKVPNVARLGDLLVREGFVDEETLKEAADWQKSEVPHQLFGSILISKGLATMEQIRRALSIQVHSAISEMLQWHEGRFYFESDPASEDAVDESEIVFDTQGILLDALRDFDERNR